MCGRPFAWRKKWARDWESVVYCSERCRRSKGSAGGGRGAYWRRTENSSVVDGLSTTVNGASWSSHTSKV